jgi:hypothetical protein
MGINYKHQEGGFVWNSLVCECHLTENQKWEKAEAKKVFEETKKNYPSDLGEWKDFVHTAYLAVMTVNIAFSPCLAMEDQKMYQACFGLWSGAPGHEHFTALVYGILITLSSVTGLPGSMQPPNDDGSKRDAGLEFATNPSTGQYVWDFSMKPFTIQGVLKTFQDMGFPIKEGTEKVYDSPWEVPICKARLTRWKEFERLNPTAKSGHTYGGAKYPIPLFFPIWDKEEVIVRMFHSREVDKSLDLALVRAMRINAYSILTLMLDSTLRDLCAWASSESEDLSPEFLACLEETEGDTLTDALLAGSNGKSGPEVELLLTGVTCEKYFSYMQPDVFMGYR